MIFAHVVPKKGFSHKHGATELIKDIAKLGWVVPVSLHVDASACKDMFLRHGSGRVNHLATKQLWAQGAIEAYSVVVCKIPRCRNAADILTHSVRNADLVGRTESHGLLSSLISTSSAGRWRGASRWRGCAEG